MLKEECDLSNREVVYQITECLSNKRYSWIDNVILYGKDDLFALVIILKQLLRPEDFTLLINELSYELDILDGRLKTISLDKVLDAMGFPTTFREIARLD